MAIMQEPLSHEQNRIYSLSFFLMATPFYLNDLANIFIKSWAWWLFVDYTGTKVFPLLVAAWLIYSKRITTSELGLKTQVTRVFLVAFLISASLGTIIDQNGYQLISKLPGYPPLGGMPEITSPLWNWIDLTIGLFMVGVCEELVFRGFLLTFLRRYTDSSPTIVMISSIAFGLIHWSLGLHVVLITSIIGAVFMMVYLKTRSLPAIMLAHFAIDFIDFSGVIPKSMFRLL